MAEFRGYNMLDTYRNNAGQGLLGGFLGEQAKQQAAIPYADRPAPKVGDERYGFVKFGQGPSLSSPSFQKQYSTTPGAGLWSAGINPDDPQSEAKAKAMLTHLLNSGNKTYQTGVWGDKPWGRDDAKIPGVRQLLAKDPNMSAKALLDYAYRAPQMQNALKPNDIGEQIGMTLGEIVVGMIPVVGPYASAMMAAAYSGANGGGLLDAALAGLGGYGAGKLGAGIGSGVSSAGGLGNYLSSLPGQAVDYVSNIPGNITNYLSHGVDLLKGDAPLTSLNTGGLFPGWVEQGAKAGLPGAVTGAGALAGGLPGTTPPNSVPGSGLVSGGAGGKNVSWLSSVLDGAGKLGISGGDLLRAGGDLLSGYLNNQAIDKASGAQTNAINNASALSAAATDKQLALIKAMYDKQLALQEPFRVAGLAGENKLLTLLGLANPKAAGFGSAAKPFTIADFYANKDPGYGFRMSEGLKALDQQAAARGGLISGNALKASQAYGQNMASDEYQRAYNRFQTNRDSLLNPLQSLAGQGQTTSNNLATLAGNYGNNAAGIIGAGANTQGELGIKAGDVRASSYLGGQNSWNSAITNALSRPGQSADNAMMKALMAKMLA